MKITIYVHPEDLSDLRDALNFESSEENEIWVGNFIRISLFPHNGHLILSPSYKLEIDYRG